MKNILLLGGTGAMGEHLAQVLLERGDKVFVTSRSSRESVGNVEYIQGNAKEDGFLELLLARKWEAIVDFMVYTTPEFKQRVLKLLTATEQYLFLSSARVYADSSKAINEESARLLDNVGDCQFLGTDEYSLAKARQEDILKQSSCNNWTIIRPYISYSEQRLQLGVLEKEEWLFRALKGRTIVFSKDIASRITTLTYGLDVACAISTLISEPRALEEVYHVTREEAMSWQRILDIYLQVLEKKLGKRPNVLLLDMDKFSQCKSADYQIKYDRLYDRKFDCTKISKFLDVNTFLSIEKGLTRCLEAFLRDPQFLAINWQEEAVKDRYSGESTRLREVGTWRQKIKYLHYRYIKL